MTPVRARLGALPLRARLVAVVVLLLVTALVATSWIVVTVIQSLMIGNLDQDLRRAGQPVARAAISGGLGRRDGGPFPSEFVVVEARAGGPAVVRRPEFSNTLPDVDPVFPTTEEWTIPVEPFTVGSTSGDVRWRAIALLLRSGPDPVGIVYVATPLSGVDQTMRSITLSLLGVTALVSAAGGALGWLAIRRSFRPLVEVEETAAAIAAGDLSRRIPEQPASTEVGSLTRSLNSMLTQIETAFRARAASEARTRRFAADASHELRTPLVSIRGFAELYRQGAVPPDEVPRTMKRIEDEAKRMGSLVEDLLLLARLDEQRPVRHEPVDLAVLAGDAVHDARGLDASRAVTLIGLNGRGPQAAPVTGDEDRLRQVVANLLGNAVRHTPPGTPIEVAVGREGPADGRTAVLEVRDHGPGIDPEHAPRVFERFYRVDSSRHRGAGGGSGLGLSIVAAVVTAHGGGAQVLTTPGGGATFRIMLPARPGPDDDPAYATEGTPGSSADVQVNGTSPAGEGIAPPS